MSTIEGFHSSKSESSEITEAVKELQENLRVMREKYDVLWSLVPKIHECTGIIQDINRLEKAIRETEKQLAELLRFSHAA